MKETVFKAVQISKHVHWVGAIDWTVRDFHGYLTNRGSTYNAYLIIADKITLVDTVKAPFRYELVSRISSLIDPEDISIIISNHSEMDHSGCLPEIIDLVKPDKVYASAMGVKNLSSHFHNIPEIIPVKDGDTISLGNLNIAFMETRMLHWPDSMFSYLKGERVLFSQDAFGMHIASHERFTDEIEDSVIEYEAAKYFANILLLYAALIPKILEKAKKYNVDPAIIAPDHGPVWRSSEDINKILGFYTRWSEQKPSQKAVVVYDTMWGSTELMARAIGEGIEKEGIHVRLLSLKGAHRSDVATEILDAGALIIGSPTINNNMFPTVADLMSYLKGLKPKNLVGAVFGSYGWSGEAVKHIEAIFDEMRIKRADESVAVEYVPDEEALLRCYNLGKLIGLKLKNNV